MKCPNASQLYSLHLQGLMVPIEIVIIQVKFCYTGIFLGRNSEQVPRHDPWKSQKSEIGPSAEELSQALERKPVTGKTWLATKYLKTEFRTSRWSSQEPTCPTRGHGFDPWFNTRFPMPLRQLSPHAPQLLSLQTEPVLCRSSYDGKARHRHRAAPARRKKQT